MAELPKLTPETYTTDIESTGTQLPNVEPAPTAEEFEKYQAELKAEKEAKVQQMLNDSFATWDNVKDLPDNHPLKQRYYALENEKYPNQPTLKGISDVEAERIRKYTEAVENPSFSDKLVELGKYTGRAIGNPLKVVGDIHSIWHPDTPLPTTEGDAKRDREIKYGHDFHLPGSEGAAYRDKLYADRERYCARSSYRIRYSWVRARLASVKKRWKNRTASSS